MNAIATPTMNAISAPGPPNGFIKDARAVFSSEGDVVCSSKIVVSMRRTNLATGIAAAGMLLPNARCARKIMARNGATGRSPRRRLVTEIRAATASTDTIAANNASTVGSARYTGMLTPAVRSNFVRGSIRWRYESRFLYVPKIILAPIHIPLASAPASNQDTRSSHCQIPDSRL